MARHKNKVWNLEDPHPGMEGAILAALMDIRDEIQELNSVFRCRRFLAIPTALDEISKNTRKPDKKKKSNV